MSSKGAYLPQWATIEEATSWLEKATGEDWPQARLLESGHSLSLGIWWRPGDAAPPEWMRDVFEGQTHGFWAPITSTRDVTALAADRTLVVTQTRTPSGNIVDFHHGMMFVLSDLRIEGSSLRALIETLKPENAHITSWVTAPPGVSEFEYLRLGEILAKASGCANESLLVEATRGNHFQDIINTRVSSGEVVLHDARTGERIQVSDDAEGNGSVIGLHDLKTLLATPFWFSEERFCFGILAPQAFEKQKDPEIEKTPSKADSQAAAVQPQQGARFEQPSPAPVSTGDIAFSFAGLKWGTEEQWKKPLGDKPKWLKACVAIPGQQGVRETLWNPVCIGAALVHKGYVRPNSVRARFQTREPIKQWLEAWKTYEAEHFDSQ